MRPFEYVILYHNYYELEGLEDIRRRIAALGEQRVLLLCSLPDKFAGALPPQGDREKFVLLPNIGKDIGGKLMLIHLLLTLYGDIPYSILVHDKRSYQKHSGAFEKEELFRILEPGPFRRIAQAFAADGELGIACAQGFLKSEWLGNGRFATTNSELLGKLAEQYGIRVKDHRFVAGTMFWIRTAVLRRFFDHGLAPAVRATLEAGNVLDHEQGTVTHCWERLFSWIATAENFLIKEF